VIDQLVPASGVASVVMLLMKGVSGFLHDIAVYGACDKSLEEEVVSLGGNIHKLPDVAAFFGRPFSKSFSSLLQSTPYEIVHGHLQNSAFMYLREAERQNIPGRIIHAHSALGADTFLKRVRNKILAKGAMRWANSYVAVSVEVAKYSFGDSCDDVHVFGNGIDASRFQYNASVRQRVRHELGIKNDVVCVGNVARFAGLKNHQFLLHVFQEMRTYENCILVLVGGGQLESVINGMVHSFGLSDYVKFLGVRRDMDKLYQAFDILLLPSLAEGFGIVAVEAQCAGLGCVVSKHVPEIVKCSKHIQFLSLGSKTEWTKTALDLSRIRRCDGAMNVEMAGLDAKTMCNNFMHLYETLLEIRHVS